MDNLQSAQEAAYAKVWRNGPCHLEGCDRPMYGRSGWCEMHYQRVRRSGSTGSLRPERAPDGLPMDQRLRARLSGTDDPTGCWPFDHPNPEGYGTLRDPFARKTISAHRLAYELWVGPIPAGLQIDHVCHSNDLTCAGGATCMHRRCCNPAHLEVVTHAVNMGRGVTARKEVCKRGHDLTDPANLKPNSRGARQCRACSNLARAERYVRLGR